MFRFKKTVLFLLFFNLFFKIMMLCYFSNEKKIAFYFRGTYKKTKRWGGYVLPRFLGSDQ